MISYVLRSKKALFFMIVILTLNVTLFLIFKPFPQLENFVAQTNKRFDYIRTLKLNDFEVDQSYLEYLGFLPETSSVSTVKGTITSKNAAPFVFGSAVSSSDYHLSYSMIESIRQILNTSPIILFDIGLSSWDANQLKKRCNETNQCRIRGFEFEKFPKHVGTLRTKAYKPLAIQILLHEFNRVIWSDLMQPPYNPIPGAWSTTLKEVIRGAGIFAWPLPSPTSALTHPRMFVYFKEKQQKYYFHRMVASAHLIIHNTRTIRKTVMLPWVKCALSEDCIFPLGAQSSGCNFNRKPYFRYSGCHYFEMSALNVVLGSAFHFNSSSYICHRKLFGTDSNDTDVSNHFPITGLHLNNFRIHSS